MAELSKLQSTKELEIQQSTQTQAMEKTILSKDENIEKDEDQEKNIEELEDKFYKIYERLPIFAFFETKESAEIEDIRKKESYKTFLKKMYKRKQRQKQR